MLSDPLMVLGVLCACLSVAEWLSRNTWLRHLGTALLVILITAVVANLGLIPTTTSGSAVYDWVLGDVVLLAIFWILLQVNLRELLKAGAPMIGLFLVGSLGTVVGVVVGMLVVGGPESFGENYVGLAAMFAGTYIGGSINFVAMASQYQVSETGSLFAGAVVVDNIFTTIWMMVTIAVPRGIGYLRSRASKLVASGKRTVSLGIDEDTEMVHPLDLAILVALGAAAIAVSHGLSNWTKQMAFEIPAMLVLTAIALILAQMPLIQRLRGTRTLGMLAVYLFLAVIGALCDVQALKSLEGGLRLLWFVAVVVGIHGAFTFGVGAVLRIDRDIVAVASQANIGGGTSALAIARSLGRDDLVLPAILVGSLGTALGNFLGVGAAQLVAVF